MQADDIFASLATGTDAERRGFADRHAQLLVLYAAERVIAADLRYSVQCITAERDQLRAEYRADLDRLAAELREVADAGLNARNKLAFLTEHLPDILADWLAPFEAFSDAGLAPEFQEKRKTVRALLQSLTPFSE